MISDELQGNLEFLRDCLSGPLVQKFAVDRRRSSSKLKPKRRKRSNKDVEHESGTTATGPPAEELGDFIDYVAHELFSSFPGEVQSLSYPGIQSDPRAAKRFIDPLPTVVIEQVLATVSPSVAESLEAYSLLDLQADLPRFLIPVLQEYVNAVTAAPPVWSTTRASACEICDRDWIPLTYHHLIPKQIHAKASKRGWHEEWRLNSVAWLCRACHSFVHRIASNEELARNYWSVDKLMEREDAVAWANWVGRVRWKAK
ncbi:MAG: hypothetical protein LQ339_000648 [Xanthoria mediterranea]|nr:MAG: hypothetical protein LQ339_000648 [Xanthoria mediterranea]